MKTNSKFWFWLVRMLPRKLVYFSFIEVIKIASTGENNCNAARLTGMDAIQKYDEHYKIF